MLFTCVSRSATKQSQVIYEGRYHGRRPSVNSIHKRPRTTVSQTKRILLTEPTAEEIKEASWVLPRAMVLSIVLNGILGFIMLITLCFCIGDLSTVLVTPTGYPFIQILYNTTNSLVATNFMTSIVIVLTVACCINNVAGASRQMFAFARDGGLPFSKYLAYVSRLTSPTTSFPRLVSTHFARKVKPGWHIPLNSVLLSLVITILLSLINIGSQVAFNALASLGVATLFSSYTISTSCICFKRWKGEPLPPSRFSLGRYGATLNMLAIAYLVIILVFSFFPSTRVVAPVTMNWSVAIYGAVLTFAMGYFWVWGRKVYRGPVVLVKRD